ncbi:hypothetical protein CIW54_23015 [Paraburkholderia sp. T12-10]|nr:hypothetical protein CIW54_23015 [Paraburkholderia sp. T12-10]
MILRMMRLGDISPRNGFHLGPKIPFKVPAFACLLIAATSCVGIISAIEESHFSAPNSFLLTL